MKRWDTETLFSLTLESKRCHGTVLVPTLTNIIVNSFFIYSVQYNSQTQVKCCKGKACKKTFLGESRRYGWVVDRQKIWHFESSSFGLFPKKTFLWRIFGVLQCGPICQHYVVLEVLRPSESLSNPDERTRRQRN